MLFSTLLTAVIGTLPVLGQGAFDKSHKMAYLKGTWSISTKNVPVGPVSSAFESHLPNHNSPRTLKRAL
jgi:hypothetical protein